MEPELELVTLELAIAGDDQHRRCPQFTRNHRRRVRGRHRYH